LRWFPGGHAAALFAAGFSDENTSKFAAPVSVDVEVRYRWKAQVRPAVAEVPLKVRRVVVSVALPFLKILPAPLA
jgi:hypothetical protein